MAPIARGSCYYSGVVEANIDALWDVFMDWGDISWIDNEKIGGPVLAKSTLEGEVDAIPRTHNFHGAATGRFARRDLPTTGERTTPAKLRTSRIYHYKAGQHASWTNVKEII